MPRTSSRLAVTTLDQLASSLGNFVLVFSLAQTATPHEFGVYAFAIAVLAFGLALGRSVVSTPFTIDNVGASTAEGTAGSGMSVARSSALALTLGSGLAGAMLPFVIGAALLTDGLASVLALFMASLPLLMLQDFLRYVAVSRGRPGVALASDLSWTGIVMGLFCFQLLADEPLHAWMCATIWALGLGVATLLLGTAGLMRRPRADGLWRHLRADRRRPQLAADALLTGGGPIVLYTLVGLLCGASAVAALRGASTVFGPFNTLLGAVTLALVPEVRRHRGPRGEGLLIGATASVSAGVVAFGVLLAMVASDRIGSALLGSTWPLTERILLATTAEYVGITMLTAGIVWCRAKNRVDVALRLQVYYWGGLLVASTATGLVFGTARAVAIGLAVTGLTFGGLCLARGRRLPYDA